MSGSVTKSNGRPSRACGFTSALSRLFSNVPTIDYESAVAAFSRGVLVGLSHRAEARGNRSLAEHVEFASKVCERDGDALFFSVDSPNESTDPYVLTAALAQRFANLVLGVCEVAPPVRHPAMLAKVLATTHVIAEGRFAIAMWPKKDDSGVSSGFARSGEAIEVVRAMLRVDAASMSGPYFPIENAWNEPRFDEPLELGVVVPQAELVGSAPVGNRDLEPVQFAANIADWCLIEMTWAGRERMNDVVEMLHVESRGAGRADDDLRLVGLIDASDVRRGSILVDQALESGVTGVVLDARAADDDAEELAPHAAVVGLTMALRR